MDCNKLFNIVLFFFQILTFSSHRNLLRYMYFPRKPKYSDWEEDNMGTFKVRNEIETKRIEINEMKRNQQKRNEVNQLFLINSFA
jgi:hypothetical protein